MFTASLLTSIAIKKFIFILTFLTSSLGYCQEESYNKNHIFVEFGGIGLYGSLNYERYIWKKDRINLGARIGLSSLKIKDFEGDFNPDLIIPFGISFYYGELHHIEVNLGSTFANTIYGSPFAGKQRQSSLNGTAFLGYRFQRDDGRIVARAGYTPIFERFSSIRHWGGISIGYQF